MKKLVKPENYLLGMIEMATETQLRAALVAVVAHRPADDDIVPAHGVEERLHSGRHESHQSAIDYNRHATEVYAAIYCVLSHGGGA